MFDEKGIIFGSVSFNSRSQILDNNGDIS